MPASRALLPIALALAALVALLQRPQTVPPSERRLSLLGRRSLGDFADPKSSHLRGEGDGGIKTYVDLVYDNAPLPQYNLQKAINAADAFQSRFALLRYDPASDRFITYYSNKHLYVSGCAKLNYATRQFTRILRILFPERFTPDSPELVLALEAGDYPDVMPYRACVSKNKNEPCSKHLAQAAPVVAFGSVFSNPLFPNMMGFPMPGDHMTCFLRWAERKELCPFFQYNQALSTMEWDQLTPQLVWRGTDFNFISIQKRHERPAFEKYYAQDGEADPNVDQAEAATAIMKENFSELMPRWQGAVLTAESELEARRTNTLPKLNMKFPRGSIKQLEWEQSGWPGIGERLNKAELANFKYHIDFGGGGGTTWTGTVDKLKMPGLLFHHETVTKDYIHDDIQPWVHYIPVKSNLSDLMEKLDWAEQHQSQAKEISDNASQLMQHLGQPQGFEELFVRHMLNPLKKIIEAYQPMGLKDEAAWNEAFLAMGGDKWTPLLECDANDECRTMEAVKDYDERDASHTTFDKLKWGSEHRQKSA